MTQLEEIKEGGRMLISGGVMASTDFARWFSPDPRFHKRVTHSTKKRGFALVGFNSPNQTGI
jgi:hypothetical protein